MMVFRRWLNKPLLAALALLLPLHALAESPITIANPSIPAPAGEVGVAYFTLTSSSDDTLTSVASDCCRAVELHTSTMDGGVMRMRKLESVPLKKGEAVAFAPGGLHVMLIGLKKPLKPGDVVPISFGFDHSPLQRADFKVEARTTDSGHQHH